MEVSPAADRTYKIRDGYNCKTRDGLHMHNKGWASPIKLKDGIEPSFSFLQECQNVRDLAAFKGELPGAYSGM